MESRGYQDIAVRRLLAALRREERVLAVGPTGCGKTVVAARVIEEFEGRVLFLAHRYELVDQAYKTLRSLGVDVGVLMAQDERLYARANATARVQVASVATVDRRHVGGRFDLVVFDEAHRVMADSYQRVHKASGARATMGLTASPTRLDGRGLGDFFQTIYEIARPGELYAANYLARPRTFTTPVDVQPELLKALLPVKRRMGDFVPGQLGIAVSTDFLVGRVVDEALRIAPHVPKVVFASSVKHSRHLAGEFEQRGIRARHLDGATSPRVRNLILAGLASGDIEVVTNVDVLSEGWDLPSLGAVIMARPTESLSKYLQMAGRVQRPYEGRVPIVIDHASNVLRHGLPCRDIEWSLRGGRERSGVPVMKACVSCSFALPGGCATCPECGAEQPIAPPTPREEKQEIPATLAEVSPTRMDEIIARVNALAAVKGAPDGWADKVVADLAR